LGVDGTSAVVWLFVIIADFCRWLWFDHYRD
jgi:hypothetical protein